MPNHHTIQVYEHDWLVVGQKYGALQVEFSPKHFALLQQYLTRNPACNYFALYLNRVRFCQYVGVIKVANLNIEVLPKTDRHADNKAVWQKALIDMLAISMRVQARTSTYASIHTRQHTVLETYLHYFLQETKTLLHQGLAKKYRRIESNQTALKGKLLIHQHVSKNVVHAERFFVQHQVYDRNNIFNRILLETLHCIQSLNVSMSMCRYCDKLLLDFPECSPLTVSPKLFQNLCFDRKTQRYQQAIELARIILLNFHPDIQGGSNNIIAIMFDMNRLWESYIYAMLYAASKDGCSVTRQNTTEFWQSAKQGSRYLKPDLLLTLQNGAKVVIDTKWKYQKEASIEDIRQMYAYGHYFGATRRYLLYPDHIPDDSKTNIIEGTFSQPQTIKSNEHPALGSCGLMFVDLLTAEGRLNKEIGERILNCLIINNY